MTDFNTIRSAIDDETYNAFINATAAQQRAFLNELSADELMNIELRYNKELDNDDAILSLRREFATRGAVPSAPGGQPMYFQQDPATILTGTVNQLMSGFREEGVDYGGVPNFSFRSGLSFADTGEEKEAYLNKNVGPKDTAWSTDKYGRYVILPQFREVVGAPAGELPLSVDNPDATELGDVADLVGMAPELIAVIGTSIATRNVGLLPAAFLNFLAGAGAKVAEETVETVVTPETQLETPGQVLVEASKEGLLAAGGEILGRGLGAGVKAVASPGEVRIPTGETGLFNFKTYTYAPRVDAASGPNVQKTQNLVRELLDEGAIPDVEKATGRPLTGRVAKLIEQIFGYNKQKNVVNVKFMNDKINKFLQEVDAEPFDPFMNKVFPKLDEAELGALILQRLNDGVSTNQVALQNSVRSLVELIDEETAILTGKVGLPEGDTGEVLKNRILSRFEEFKSSTNALYDEADQILGNRAIVPTEPLKVIAADILSGLPKDQGGMIVSGFNDSAVALLQGILDTPAYISAKQMSAYRTLFGDAAYSDDLLKGIGNRNYTLLKDAANDAFETAGQDGLKIIKRTDKNGNILLTERALTAKERQNIDIGISTLREATKLYGEGIKVFDNRLIKQLTNAKNEVDPSRILDISVKRNSPNLIKNLVNATSDPDAATKVLRAGHWDDMLGKATNTEGNLNISSLLRQIKYLGTTYPAIYGDLAPELTRTLTQLNNVTKFIPKSELDKLKPAVLEGLESGNLGNYKSAVTDYLQNVRTNYDLLNKTFTQALRNRAPEEIIPYLTNRGTSRQITEFIDYFSQTSPEVVDKFRQTFMVNLLDNVFVSPRGNPVGIVLDGSQLNKAITAQDMPKRLATVFGDDTAKALQRFAEQAEFLTTSSGDMAGNLAANQIALNPLNNVSRLIKLKVLGSVLSNPTTLKYLSTIQESKNKRDIGFAVINFGSDLIAQMTKDDPTLDPERTQKLLTELQYSVSDFVDTDFNIDREERDE